MRTEFRRNFERLEKGLIGLNGARTARKMRSLRRSETEGKTKIYGEE